MTEATDWLQAELERLFDVAHIERVGESLIVTRHSGNTMIVRVESDKH